MKKIKKDLMTKSLIRSYNSRIMLKFIPILIVFIFSFENAGYCLRVPMVIDGDRFRRAESDVTGKSIKIKYQSINDIALQEVKDGEEGFESAMPVICHTDDSMRKVENKLREQLIRDNWWLKTIWTQKGLPKEQISITINGYKVDVYNWNDERLSEEQIAQITGVLSKFAIIAGGIALKGVRYILIDNLKDKNTKSGEEINGLGKKISILLLNTPYL